MSWTLGRDNIEVAGQAIFEARKHAANNLEGVHRVAMTYRTYKWEDLPESARIHHRDLAVAAFTSLGVDVKV